MSVILSIAFVNRSNWAAHEMRSHRRLEKKAEAVKVDDSEQRFLAFRWI